jgi:hypothetical protein
MLFGGKVRIGPFVSFIRHPHQGAESGSLLQLHGSSIGIAKAVNQDAKCPSTRPTTYIDVRNAQIAGLKLCSSPTS